MNAKLIHLRKLKLTDYNYFYCKDYNARIAESLKESKRIKPSINLNSPKDKIIYTQNTYITFMKLKLSLEELTEKIPIFESDLRKTQESLKECLKDESIKNFDAEFRPKFDKLNNLSNFSILDYYSSFRSSKEKNIRGSYRLDAEEGSGDGVHTVKKFFPTKPHSLKRLSPPDEGHTDQRLKIHRTEEEVACAEILLNFSYAEKIGWIEGIKQKKMPTVQKL